MLLQSSQAAVDKLVVTTVSIRPINTILFHAALQQHSGGVAQWSGRRSFADGLSLIYA